MTEYAGFGCFENTKGYICENYFFFGSVKFSHLLEFVRGCSYLDKNVWPKKYYPHLGSKIAYFYSSVLDQKMHFS